MIIAIAKMYENHQIWLNELTDSYSLFSLLKTFRYY